MSQNIAPPPIPIIPPSPVSEPGTYRAGALRYNLYGLIVVCFWLVWGGFVSTLCDGSIPGILPLAFKDLGASIEANALLNKTIAYLIAFVLAPIVSFWSDRHRGRRGRRIPFLLWSTPFVGLFLVLIGLHQDFASLVLGDVPSMQIGGFVLTKASISIAILAVLIVGYNLANVFIGTIQWYLFNDVVPQGVMARFLSVYRIGGTGAGMLYSGFLFPHAIGWFRYMFIAAGFGLVIGFLLMCFMVKEGPYPPPPPNYDGRKGFGSAFITFFAESFGHKFFWFFFLANTFMFVSWQTGMFTTLRNRNVLGLTLQDLGTLGMYSGYASLLLMFPLAWVVDILHPVRVYVVAAIANLLSLLAQCIWIFADFGPAGNLTMLYVISFVFMPIGIAQGAAELPLYMRIFPKSRYGQFCAANAMVRSLTLFAMPYLAGRFMGLLQYRVGLGERAYCWYPVWTLFFQIVAIVFLLLVYKEWKARGGVKGYVPPLA